MGNAVLPPGIGNPQQALQATAFLREQPWYQQQLRTWGYDPSRIDSNGNLAGVKFTDAQKDQLLNLARQKGIGISDRYRIDENGQIAEDDSHWLRNTLIGAGLVGAHFVPVVGPLLDSALLHAGHGIASGLGAAGHGLGTAFNVGGGAGATAAGETGMAGGSSALTSFFNSPLAGSGVQGAFQYAGGKKQADAAENAARMQIEGYNHAADLQKQSSDATLAFQRQQAQNDYENKARTDWANYNQYAARQRAFNTIRSALGLRGAEIMPYVPMVNPNFTSSAPSTIAGARGN